MDKLVFADLNGTYDSHPEIHGMVKGIITGNSWENFDDIDPLDVPIFFNPLPKDGEHSLINIVNHKANIINKIGVTDFYENEPQQKNMLVIMCPKCKIHLVEEFRTAI